MHVPCLCVCPRFLFAKVNKKSATAAADDDVVFSSKPRKETSTAAPKAGGAAGGSAASAASVAASAAAAAAARAAPDWACPACGASVFATRDACYKCKEPRPETGSRPDKAPASSAKQQQPVSGDGGGGFALFPPDAAAGGPALIVPIESGYDLSKWTGKTPQNLLCVLSVCLSTRGHACCHFLPHVVRSVVRVHRLYSPLAYS
jgi:hypothetical protein